MDTNKYKEIKYEAIAETEGRSGSIELKYEMHQPASNIIIII